MCRWFPRFRERGGWGQRRYHRIGRRLSKSHIVQQRRHPRAVMRTVRAIVEESKRLDAWDQASYISQHLQEAFPVKAIRLWHFGEPFSREGRRIFIGVATYSLPEMRALDALIDAASHASPINGAIDVFDTAECRNLEDLRQLVPGIGPSLHTPIVGVWEDGVLREKASGAEARKLLTARCDLEPSVWS